MSLDIANSRIGLNNEIISTAFELCHNEQYLSVNWIECCGAASMDDAMSMVCSSLDKKLQIKLGKRIALLCWNNQGKGT